MDLIFGTGNKEEEIVEEKSSKKDDINLLSIVNMLFKNRRDFSKVPHETKEKFGFIINRMLCRVFPEYAQKLNIRSADMGMILNLWWVYLADKNIPYYNSTIWIKGKLKKKDIDKETYDLLRENYSYLKDEDMLYLIHWYENFSDELDYIKKVKEDYG